MIVILAVLIQYVTMTVLLYTTQCYSNP